MASRQIKMPAKNHAEHGHGSRKRAHSDGEVAKALAEVVDRALVDKESLASVILFTFTRGIVALGRFSWRPRHLLHARRSSQR